MVPNLNPVEHQHDITVGNSTPDLVEWVVVKNKGMLKILCKKLPLACVCKVYVKGVYTHINTHMSFMFRSGFPAPYVIMHM
jgi:hypothetical protein